MLRWLYIAIESLRFSRRAILGEHPIYIGGIWNIRHQLLCCCLWRSLCFFGVVAIQFRTNMANSSIEWSGMFYSCIFMTSKHSNSMYFVWFLDDPKSLWMEFVLIWLIHPLNDPECSIVVFLWPQNIVTVCTLFLFQVHKGYYKSDGYYIGGFMLCFLLWLSSLFEMYIIEISTLYCFVFIIN